MLVSGTSPLLDRNGQAAGPLRTIRTGVGLALCHHLATLQVSSPRHSQFSIAMPPIANSAPLSRRHWLVLAGSWSLAGCLGAPRLLEGIKDPAEPLTEFEWSMFRTIVDRMSKEDRQTLPQWLPTSSVWPETRTLAISELTLEEQKSLERLWTPTEFAKPMRKQRSLRPLLKSERVAPEQLAALSLVIGMATSRIAFSKGADLTGFQRKAQAHITALSNDHRIYAQLDADQRFLVIQRAAWIVRGMVATKLLQLPDETLELVRLHKGWVERTLPPFVWPSLNEVLVDQGAQNGVPFRELPSSPSDGDLVFSEEDRPDALDSAPAN